jgi:hypothetical protein
MPSRVYDGLICAALNSVVLKLGVLSRKQGAIHALILKGDHAGFAC